MNRYDKEKKKETEEVQKIRLNFTAYLLGNTRSDVICLYSVFGLLSLIDKYKDRIDR